jgi:hypothetical protein
MSVIHDTIEYCKKIHKSTSNTSQILIKHVYNILKRTLDDARAYAYINELFNNNYNLINTPKIQRLINTMTKYHSKSFVYELSTTIINNIRVDEQFHEWYRMYDNMNINKKCNVYQQIHNFSKKTTCTLNIHTSNINTSNVNIAFYHNGISNQYMHDMVKCTYVVINTFIELDNNINKKPLRNINICFICVNSVRKIHNMYNESFENIKKLFDLHRTIQHFNVASGLNTSYTDKCNIIVSRLDGSMHLLIHELGHSLNLDGRWENFIDKSYTCPYFKFKYNKLYEGINNTTSTLINALYIVIDHNEFMGRFDLMMNIECIFSMFVAHRFVNIFPSNHIYQTVLLFQYIFIKMCLMINLRSLQNKMYGDDTSFNLIMTSNSYDSLNKYVDITYNIQTMFEFIDKYCKIINKHYLKENQKLIMEYICVNYNYGFDNERYSLI